DAETDVEAHRMNFDFFSLSRKACDFLEEQVKADKPFYLQLSHYAVHKQLQSLAETQAKYEMKKRGKWRYRAEFAACAEDLDTGIGIVLDKLAGSRIDGRRRFFLSDARHEIQRAVKVERSNS
ncbi:MAG: sulfatase-like hydrolase/transferase, partial [Akkermansiaceae bacterium]|nr:sulfatase-like hydrolase/transferase [Akkermansiaceae bacterium]